MQSEVGTPVPGHSKICDIIISNFIQNLNHR